MNFHGTYARFAWYDCFFVYSFSPSTKWFICFFFFFRQNVWFLVVFCSKLKEKLLINTHRLKCCFSFMVYARASVNFSLKKKTHTQTRPTTLSIGKWKQTAEKKHYRILYALCLAPYLDFPNVINPKNETNCEICICSTSHDVWSKHLIAFKWNAFIHFLFLFFFCNSFVLLIFLLALCLVVSLNFMQISTGL